MNKMIDMKQTNMDKYKDFLFSIESEKSRSVYKSYSSLGEFDYTDCDYDLVVKAILSTNPKNVKAITTACNVLKKYAKYLGDTHLIRVVDTVDRKKLWEDIKPDEIQKYISHSQYKSICHEIEMYEEHNSLYYTTLFMAVYEGIYNADLSVIKNLRIKNIKDDKVLLIPDNGESYWLKISKELVENLKELSKETHWKQFARYGYTNKPLIGSYHDNCFKTVQRKGATHEDFFYRTKLKKISTDYVEHPLSPFNLFISGMMFRITEKLKEEGISLQEAFSLHNRDKQVAEIFSDEFNRCRYSNVVRNFRELVVNHLDVFLE